MSAVATSRKKSFNRLRSLLLEGDVKITSEVSDEIGIELDHLNVISSRDENRGTLDLVLVGVVKSISGSSIPGDIKIEVVLANAQADLIARKDILIQQEGFVDFELFEVRFVDLAEDPANVLVLPSLG